jgi:hypothetical protein
MFYIINALRSDKKTGRLFHKVSPCEVSASRGGMPEGEKTMSSFNRNKIGVSTNKLNSMRFIETRAHLGLVLLAGTKVNNGSAIP